MSYRSDDDLYCGTDDDGSEYHESSDESDEGSVYSVSGDKEFYQEHTKPA